MSRPNSNNEECGLHKLCWSRDDKLLLGCCVNQVFIWTVETAQLVEIFSGDGPRPKRIQSVRSI